MSILCSMVGASFTVAVTVQVLRAKKVITAVGNAQVSTAQSKFGGASALFDGNGDYLTLGTESDLNFGTSDFTIEAWVYFDQLSTTNRHTLISNGVTSFTTNWIKFSAADLGAAYYPQVTAYNYSSGGTPMLTSNTAVSNGQWYHLAYVRYNTDHYLYLNGTQVASNSDSTAKSISVNFNANNQTNIGRYAFDNGTNPSSTYFDGYMDELRISNIARYTANFTATTAAFVNDDNTLLLIHANGTNATTVFEDDNGVRASTGVLSLGNAQVSTAQSKFGGASAYFDGTSTDMLAYRGMASNPTGDMTIEGWLYFLGVPNTGDSGYMMFHTANGDNYINLYQTNKIQLAVGGRYGTVTTPVTFATGTWYHLAVVRSSGTYKVYWNGTDCGAFTNDASWPPPSPTFDWPAVDAHFGRFVDTRGDWYGYMDELRISNSARYTTGFTPSTTPFVNDANTLLLIHADGTNTSKVFRDDNAQLSVNAASYATSVNEGSSLTFNVSTINASNQTLYWTVTNSGDFTTSSGSFGLSNNAGSFSVIPTADTTTEGAETFQAEVRVGSTSGGIVATTPAVTINDTSVASVPAVAFDGTGDYYEVTVGSSSGVADSLYTTFAGLIYKNVTGEHNVLQIQLGTASGNNGFNLSTWTNGGIIVNQPDNSGSDTSSIYGTAGNVGSWMQFVLYVDWSNFANCKYYVNGVDQTSASLLNGPSYGDRGVDNSPMNWTSATQCKINVGGFFTYAGARDVSDFNGKIQYLLVKAGAGAPTISNYWDSATSKPKDLGTNGNATGLAPNVYHYGNTSTFAVNNASNKFATYTLTKYGNTSDTSGTPYA